MAGRITVPSTMICKIFHAGFTSHAPGEGMSGTMFSPIVVHGIGSASTSRAKKEWQSRTIAMLSKCTGANLRPLCRRYRVYPDPLVVHLIHAIIPTLPDTLRMAAAEQYQAAVHQAASS